MAALSSTLMSAATTGVGVSDQTRHRLVDGSGQDTQFWVQATAVRTYAVTGPLLWSLSRGRRPAPGILLAASLTQFGDAYLCLRQKNPAGAAATAAYGILHLITARKTAPTHA